MNALSSLDDAQRRLRETLTNLHQARAAHKSGNSWDYIHNAIDDIERVQRSIDKARRKLSEATEQKSN